MTNTLSFQSALGRYWYVWGPYKCRDAAYFHLFKWKLEFQVVISLTAFKDERVLEATRRL